MESIRNHFTTHDQFAKANHFELIEVAEGYAKTRMVVCPQHLNSVGTVHGGAYFSLADLAFGAASNTGGRIALGLSMTLTCIKAVTGGTLVAEAREVARTYKTSTCEVRITDQDGELVAIFQGVAYIKNETFPPKISDLKPSD